MEISSLLNTGLGIWNVTVFPCIITFTSFQNLQWALVKKVKNKFPDENKNIFSKSKIELVQAAKYKPKPKIMFGRSL